MPDGGISSVIGGIAGAAGSIIGGSQAAKAAEKAAELQHEQYLQTRADLLPYNTAGQSVLGDLTTLAKSGPYGGGTNYLAMAEANLPMNMTQEQLEKTPGYQFNLSQGLKATQSAAAARGLGVSGAALKGAATYATGLADSTYQNQFANAQQRFSDILNLNTGQQANLTNQYNRLAGVATLGENAAAQTGVAGTAAANAAGNYTTQAGLANAAGFTGASNALTGGINNYLAYNALQNALKPSSGTTGGFTNADTLTASQVTNHGS
jgi:hypothetical protein